jgi:hypothetical protein
MLEFLVRTGRASDRKCRLFARACFRRLPPLHTNKTRSRRARTNPAYVRRALKAVAVSERYADGGAARGRMSKEVSESTCCWGGPEPGPRAGRPDEAGIG